MKLLLALRQLMRRLLRRDPAEPPDPYARVPATLRRGPGGRSAAVALEEPPEPTLLRAFGRRQTPGK